jgi:hypothetical protein
LIVDVNTHSEFNNVNLFAGLYSPDFSPVVSYNPKYGFGVGDVTNSTNSSFFYPSYNPPSAEQKADEFINKAKSFFSDGIWTVGASGNVSLGILGGSAEIGLAIDARKGLEIGWYTSVERSIGFDLSIDIIANYNKPTENQSISISDLSGWGESYNGGIWYIGGTYGGNSLMPGWNPNTMSDIHTLYRNYGIGFSYGIPISFATHKGKTTVHKAILKTR